MSVIYKSENVTKSKEIVTKDVHKDDDLQSCNKW